MSFYFLIGGAVLEVVGVALITSAALVLRVKANQQENANDKRTLLAASIFMGVSILFIVATLVSLFTTLTKGKCKKGRSIPLIIFASLAFICLTVAIVITQIFLARKKREGDTNSARDFRSAIYLPIVAIGLMLLGFLIFFVIIGRRLRKATRLCQKAASAKSTVSAN